MKFYKIIKGNSLNNAFIAENEEDYYSFQQTLEDGEEIIEIEKEEYNMCSTLLLAAQEIEEDTGASAEDVATMNLRLISLDFFRNVNHIPTNMELNRIYNWLNKK